MKSGFYYTNPKREKWIKPVNLFPKYISPYIFPQNRHNYYDIFPMIFLWFSYDFPDVRWILMNFGPTEMFNPHPWPPAPFFSSRLPLAHLYDCPSALQPSSEENPKVQKCPINKIERNVNFICPSSRTRWPRLERRGGNVSRFKAAWDASEIHMDILLEVRCSCLRCGRKEAVACPIRKRQDQHRWASRAWGVGGTNTRNMPWLLILMRLPCVRRVFFREVKWTSTFRYMLIYAHLDRTYCIVGSPGIFPFRHVLFRVCIQMRHWH